MEDKNNNQIPYFAKISIEMPFITHVTHVNRSRTNAMFTGNASFLPKQLGVVHSKIGARCFCSMFRNYFSNFFYFSVNINILW